MLRRMLLLSVLLLQICHSSFAQRYHYRQYSNEEGLSQSQVMFIFEDSHGYLWVTTNGGGINRYDGKDFAVFTTREGLNNNLITEIVQDPHQNLWLKSYHEAGICRYDGVRFTTYGEGSGLCSDRVYDIHSDRNGNVWMGTDKGLCRFRYDAGGKDSFMVYTRKNGLPDDTVRVIMEDRNGNIWIASGRSGVTVFDGTGFSVIDSAGGMPDNSIRKMAEDRNGDVWMLGENGALARFNVHARTFTAYGSRDGLKDGKAQNICRDARGHIWVLTGKRAAEYNGKLLTVYGPSSLPYPTVDLLEEDGRGGVWLVSYGSGVAARDSAGFITYPTDRKLVDNRVWCVMRDSHGSLWLGTNGAGIIKYPSRSFTLFYSEDGLAGKLVFGIGQDRKGDMWFTSYGRGLSVYNGKTFRAITTKDGLAHDFTWDIEIDEDDNKWIATSGGLVHYDGRRFRTYTTEDGLIDNTVYALCRDSRGKIWLGYSEGGFSIFDGKNFTSLGKKEGIEKYVQCFAEDSKGVMWFGTDGQGLGRYDGKQVKFYTKEHGLTDDYIMALATDSAGNIWIGTQGGGINRYDGEKFSGITTSNGLSNDAIMSLLFDRHGHLWAGTNRGLNQIKFTSRGTVESIKTYGSLEGFTGIECNAGAIFGDRQGNIWIGSTVLTRYDPREDRTNTVPPKIHLTNIRLFFKDIDLSYYGDSISPWFNVPQNFTLPYDRNHLTFEFIGISLKMPELVKYQFKLEGLDKDWSPYTHKNEAIYSSIPPGKYSFMVMARNEDKVWNDEPVILSFTILPPFWQTWWFYGLCSLSLGLTIYLFVRWRLHALHRAKALLENKVRERTETIRHQKDELQQAYNEIRSSIEYARKIQDSILPPRGLLEELLPDSFVLYRPKDIVSGDFYWIERKNGKALLAAVDCTGHGVPGAFMSIMGHSKLNQIIREDGESVEPAGLLNRLNEEVTRTLDRGKAEESAKDGMDISLCTLDLDKMELQYAGAYSPIYLIRNDELQIIKGDKFPIGIFLGKTTKRFTNHRISLLKNDLIYLFSDGFADQFGGPGNKKFLSARFRSLLMEIRKKSMQEQLRILEERFLDWKGDENQVDDILVIGFRV